MYITFIQLVDSVCAVDKMKSYECDLIVVFFFSLALLHSAYTEHLKERTRAAPYLCISASLAIVMSPVLIMDWDKFNAFVNLKCKS